MRTNLSYLGERQDVLSQNIANANTPGYQGKDLKPMDFSNILNSVSNNVQVHKTNVNHIAGTKNAYDFSVTGDRRPFEVSPTKNAVNLEDQMMKASKNSMEYQQTTNVYRKMLEMLKTAIGNS